MANLGLGASVVQSGVEERQAVILSQRSCLRNQISGADRNYKALGDIKAFVNNDTRVIHDVRGSFDTVASWIYAILA